jgi:hypothetical protein
MASDKRVVYEKWPKGTLLRVDAELMGGSLLKTLDRQEPAEGTHKVKLSARAFEALKALRNRGGNRPKLRGEAHFCCVARVAVDF